MPVYSCYRGDCSNLALNEGGCFFLKDALGREWVCVQTELSEIPSDLGVVAGDMLRAQQLVHKQGFSLGGTQRMLMVAPDAEALGHQLILSTYPPVWESMERLQREGWGHGWEELRTGKPNRVSVSNGQQTLEAEGENSNEAWFRVLQKAMRKEE
jgi:hypothetical protein